MSSSQIENASSGFSITTNVIVFFILSYLFYKEVFPVIRKTNMKDIKNCYELKILFSRIVLGVLFYFIFFISNTAVNIKNIDNLQKNTEEDDSKTTQTFNIIFGIMMLYSMKYLINDEGENVNPFITIGLYLIIVISMILNISVLVKQKNDDQIIKSSSGITMFIYSVYVAIVLSIFVLGAIKLNSKLKVITSIICIVLLIIMFTIIEINHKVIKENNKVNKTLVDYEFQRNVSISNLVLSLLFGIFGYGSIDKNLSFSDSINNALLLVTIYIFLTIFNIIYIYYISKSIQITNKRIDEPIE